MFCTSLRTKVKKKLRHSVIDFIKKKNSKIMTIEMFCTSLRTKIQALFLPFFKGLVSRLLNEDKKYHRNRTTASRKYDHWNVFESSDWKIQALHSFFKDFVSRLLIVSRYRDSPDGTVFVPPGNRTIAKTVLIGDWFSTKIAIYDFWIFKVPFFPWFIYWT